MIDAPANGEYIRVYTENLGYGIDTQMRLAKYMIMIDETYFRFLGSC